MVPHRDMVPRVISPLQGLQAENKGEVEFGSQEIGLSKRADKTIIFQHVGIQIKSKVR